MENYTFRKASAADAGAIMEIIDFARHKMLDEGKRQWDEHYPALRDIMADIDHVKKWGSAIAARYIMAAAHAAPTRKWFNRGKQKTLGASQQQGFH